MMWSMNDRENDGIKYGSGGDGGGGWPDRKRARIIMGGGGGADACPRPRSLSPSLVWRRSARGARWVQRLDGRRVAVAAVAARRALIARRPCSPPSGTSVNILGRSFRGITFDRFQQSGRYAKYVNEPLNENSW